MTKRFCDRCGKEVGVFKDIEFQTWWTITRHGMMDLTTELCDACYQAKFTADTPQTDLSTEEFVEGMKNLKMEVRQTDCGWSKPNELV